MPGPRSFDPVHATRRPARRERRGAILDRVPGRSHRGLRPRAIETAGSHVYRVEGGLRALVGGLRRYHLRDRSLRKAGRRPTMPGPRACDGADSSVGDRDFQASVIGDGVVHRQGIEPSLVAFRASGRRASWLRCRRSEPSLSEQRGFDAGPVCDAGRPGKLSSSGTQRTHAGHRDPDVPVVVTTRPDPARRPALTFQTVNPRALLSRPATCHAGVVTSHTSPLRTVRTRARPSTLTSTPARPNVNGHAISMFASIPCPRSSSTSERGGFVRPVERPRRASPSAAR